MKWVLSCGLLAAASVFHARQRKQADATTPRMSGANRASIAMRKTARNVRAARGSPVVGAIPGYLVGNPDGCPRQAKIGRRRGMAIGHILEVRLLTLPHGFGELRKQ
jgi:hypothetical protein